MVTLSLKLYGFHNDLEKFKVKFTAPSLGVAGTTINGPRIHVSHAGVVMGRMLMIMTDAHLKWVDVHPTTAATFQETINKPRQTFGTLGIPRKILSDNAAVFTSSKFRSS